MGFALMWIESLAVSLLLTATLLACVARLKRGRARSLLAWLAPAPPLLLLGSTVVDLFILRATPILGPSPIALTVLMIVIAVAAWRMRSRALRAEEGEGGAVAGATWPRGRLALGSLGAVVLLSTTFGILDRDVKDWLDAIQVEAGAIALAAAPPPIADRDNAALLYDEVFEELRQKSLWNRLADKVDLGEDEEIDWSNEEIVGILEESRPVLSMIREAASYPAYGLERVTAVPYFNENRRPFMPMLRAGQLTAIDVRHKAHLGDARGAIEGLNTLDRLTVHISDLRWLLSTMISIEIEMQAAASLAKVLEMPDLTIELLDELLLNETLSHLRSFNRSLRLEEASVLAMFAQMASSPGLLSGEVGLELVDVAFPDIGGVYRIFFLPRDLANFRIQMARLRSLSSRPYYEVRGELGSVGRKPGERVGLIGGIFTTAVGPQRRKIDQGDAWRRLSSLAVAVKRHELRTGSAPQSLDDLDAESIRFVPRDPYSGLPMRYIASDDEWLVYSVGEDGKDNAGGEDDFAIRVERR